MGPRGKAAKQHTGSGSEHGKDRCRSQPRCLTARNRASPAVAACRSWQRSSRMLLLLVGWLAGWPASVSANAVLAAIVCSSRLNLFPPWRLPAGCGHLAAEASTAMNPLNTSSSLVMVFTSWSIRSPKLALVAAELRTGRSWASWSWKTTVPASTKKVTADRSTCTSRGRCSGTPRSSSSLVRALRSPPEGSSTFSAYGISDNASAIAPSTIVWKSSSSSQQLGSSQAYSTSSSAGGRRSGHALQQRQQQQV
eukprot:SAG22_NODE_725_length_7622_cov_1.958926_6_plen_252_part_00